MGTRLNLKPFLRSGDLTDQQTQPAACDEVSPVIVASVSHSVEEDHLVSEENDRNLHNNQTYDEKVSVVANKDSPVVIFSEEDGQDRNSSEFTFGFEVSEELRNLKIRNTRSFRGPVREPIVAAGPTMMASSDSTAGVKEASDPSCWTAATWPAVTAWI